MVDHVRLIRYIEPVRAAKGHRCALRRRARWNSHTAYYRDFVIGDARRGIPRREALIIAANVRGIRCGQYSRGGKFSMADVAARGGTARQIRAHICTPA